MSKSFHRLIPLLALILISTTVSVYGESELETVLELKYGGTNHDQERQNQLILQHKSSDHRPDMIKQMSGLVFMRMF